MQIGIGIGSGTGPMTCATEEEAKAHKASAPIAKRFIAKSPYNSRGARQPSRHASARTPHSRVRQSKGETDHASPDLRAPCRVHAAGDATSNFSRLPYPHDLSTSGSRFLLFLHCLRSSSYSTIIMFEYVAPRFPYRPFRWRTPLMQRVRAILLVGPQRRTAHVLSARGPDRDHAHTIVRRQRSAGALSDWNQRRIPEQTRLERGHAA